MLQIDKETLFKLQRGSICNEEMLVGDEIWGLFEQVQRALYKGQTVELTVHGKVVSTMRQHPISGWLVLDNDIKR